MDKNTGAYLKKTNSADTCAYHTEFGSYYDQDKKKYQACENDLLLPIATVSSDFRVDGNSRGMWHQSTPSAKQNSTSTSRRSES